MGLFDLFRRNPNDALQRAEDLLAKGVRVDALHAARAVIRRFPSHADAARGLERRAQDAIAHNALEEAVACQRAEMLDEAVDWLDTALLHLPPGPEREQADGMLAALRLRLEGAAEEVPETEPERDDEDTFHWDLDTHFDTLVDMLRPELATRYREQPTAFREAVINLNEGRLEAAGEALDELVEAQPDDGLLRLERGRCRLLTGAAAEAVPDLDRAWKDLGDEPLDLAGSIHVPALWAEAAIENGDAQAVLDRLRDDADPADGKLQLIYPYGLALSLSERWDDSRRHFATALERFPDQQAFVYELAQALVHLGKIPQAVDCLETGVAPSCVGGSCATKPKHVPSFRLLVDLYLVDDDSVRDLQRAGELLAMLEDALGRQMSSDDYDLVARFYEAIGDDDTAAEARERQQALSSAEAQGRKVPELLSEPIVRPGAGTQRRAL